jgi:formimidoylglutamate deiminase
MTAFSTAPHRFALHADHALTPEGWARGVRVTVEAGRIASVETNAGPQPGDERLTDRALLPAPANLHSHAFQRAMAGMTERRGPGSDDFWTWRRLMYRFLDLLTPDQIEAIAAMVQVEMLEAGYAASVEFHYVHHQPGGLAYDNRAELSARICAAAQTSGIGLTLAPVLYTYGGAGKAPLQGGQLRFGNDLDGFSTIMAGAGRALAALPADARLAAAPHSLRATRPDQLNTVAEAWPDMPLHIHAAEQVREVEDVVAWQGMRPVEYLLDRVGLSDRWCLIHCTQMTADETARLAAVGAVAGLCPITESNLGDGIFEGDAFRRVGGRFGVGSDSDVRIALGEELRTLEYSQRLRHRARNVMADEGASVGETLYRGALAGGGQAAGRDSGALAPGLWADMLAIDVTDLRLAPLTPDQWLDGWIFAADDRVVRTVWSAGRAMVRDGRHVARDAVEARYRAAMAALTGAL